MVDKELRAINRAICLLGEEHVEEREAARTALHHLFGRIEGMKKDRAYWHKLYWQCRGGE